VRKIILDTNAYAAFKQGHSEVIKILQHADIIGICTIVLGELLAGFEIGTKSRKNLEELNQFLSSGRINIFPIDEATPTFYARIYATLRRKGKPIPTNDIWIAATTLQQGCKICTFDGHFKAIDNLVVSTSLAEFLL
jgi:predicted nucleic acid-binding protein